MVEGEQKASYKYYTVWPESRQLAVAAVAVLFVLSLWLWTLPFQDNPLPFGEGDSAWHFAIGDHIASSDKATFRLPYYVGVWYYGFNKLLGPFAPEYPPPNHVNYALMQIAGGGRFEPVLIYRAIASFLGAFALFFMLHRIFGLLPAALAALALAFSAREQSTYLFGQQPTLTAILITPVAMYAWYRFIVSLYESGTVEKKYLFASAALLASQYLLHLQGFVASAVLMAAFAVIMAVRHRRIPLSKSLIKPAAIAAVLLLAIAIPFASIYFGPEEKPGPTFMKFSRLMEWGISPEYYQGSYPPTFTIFSAEYPGLLPIFLAGGIILLLLRLFLVKNNTKELFLLSWLVGTYIVLHLDVITGTGVNRLARMLVLENFTFFSLIAMSVVWLPSTLSSFLKLNTSMASAAKYSLAAILAVIIVLGMGKASYSGSSVEYNGFSYPYGNIKSAYGGIDRITPVQAGFAEWLRTAVPEDAFIYDPSVKIVGQWRYPKMRWMLATSERHIARYEGGPVIAADFINPDMTYFLFDYSDIAIFASSAQYQQQAAAWASQLQQVEASLFNNTQPLYDSNNIRLYKYQEAAG